MAEKKTWLIYIRKSVVRNDTDLESPERQLAKCQARLTLLDEPVNTEVYTDLDKSGSNEAGRPAWLDLRAQLDRPDVAGVVAASIDRMSRNVAEFLQFVSEMEANKKAIITAKENLNTTDPWGRFVVTILMAIYEMEWRLTSQRMTDMVAYKRREQGRHWGPAPFGTERDASGQLIPSAAVDAAGLHYHDALSEMFRQFSTGEYTYDGLTDSLNAAGWRYLDRYGRSQKFNRDQVREILARWRLYRGDLPLGNSRKGKNIEWLNGGHAPILPVELCDAVGSVLSERARPAGRQQPAHRKHILSGVLYCECGVRLIGVVDHGLFVYRHPGARGSCPYKWTPAENAENTVIDGLIELTRHPEIQAGIRAKLAKMSTVDAAANSQIGILEAKLDRLEDLYVDGLIARDKYLTKRGHIISQMATLPPAQHVSPKLADNVISALNLLKNASRDTQQDIIATLFDRVVTAGPEIKTVSPKPWAKPFFASCQQWAGWESNPHNTKHILPSWLLSVDA